MTFFQQSLKAQSGNNHNHMVVLYTTWYNFVRQHKTLRCSPAMANGLSRTLWNMKDISAYQCPGRVG